MVINGFIAVFGNYIKKQKKSVWLVIYQPTAALLIQAICCPSGEQSMLT
jgi:hypothetical protein